MALADIANPTASTMTLERFRMNPPLELEIDRELDLTGQACVDWPSECRPRREQRPVHGVDLRDVRPIQEIEGFHDEVELSVRLDGEVLENPDIERCG